MRICRIVKSGKIIEAQSHATAGTLLKNAVNCGYYMIDVEEVEITDAEFEELSKLIKEGEITYADNRRAEYPPMSDYLDGIVKGDIKQVQLYINTCLAVKAKYPKP